MIDRHSPQPLAIPGSTLPQSEVGKGRRRGVGNVGRAGLSGNSSAAGGLGTVGVTQAGQLASGGKAETGESPRPRAFSRTGWTCAASADGYLYHLSLGI